MSFSAKSVEPQDAISTVSIATIKFGDQKRRVYKTLVCSALLFFASHFKSTDKLEKPATELEAGRS